MKIIFIADFFVEQVLGGGELNNDELLKTLVSNGHGIIKMNSHNLTESFIKNNKEDLRSYYPEFKEWHIILFIEVL